MRGPGAGNRAAVAAVSRSRARDGRRPSCPPVGPPVVLLLSGELDARLLRGADCALSDVFLADGEQRLLTGEVASWSLPPGRSSSLLNQEPGPAG